MAVIDQERSSAKARPDKTKAPEPKLSDKPISPDRYYSREIWQKEWETIWTRTWQIAGVIQQLQKPGDYLTMPFGVERILCVKGDDGKVRAFYNVCQHRGMMLMSGEQGHSRRLVCPYHGWAYDLKGTLRVVPEEADYPQGSPCGKLNLVEIPCESWAGFIWFNMDPNCISLREYMAPVADQIDCYPMDDMVRTHWVTIEGNFNWKLVQDNFNESYHVPFVHPQTKYVMEYSHVACQFDLYPSGHARMFLPGDTPTVQLQGGEEETLRYLAEHLKFWELDPDQFRGGKTREIRAAVQKQKRKLGAAKGYDFSRYDDDQLTDHWHYTIFPNLSFSLKPDGNIWLRARPHPTDPEKCFFDMWYLTLFPKGATKYYSQSMAEWVDIGTPAPHEEGKWGEVSMGPGIDQDVAVWEVQQKALHSRGYRRDYLAWQERRVRFFHDNLDRWMAR
jgi:phenylpropionate dioxygenase-like ring-hydroxylating dioxygenase large terminal subunit